MQTSYHLKGEAEMFVLKQGHPQAHLHLKAS